MTRFSAKALVAPSATIAINTLALQKKAAGERVFNFAAGDPMLPAHPAVSAAARLGLEKGLVLYPPIAGIPELREAALEWMNTTYSTRYRLPHVLVTCGGKFALFAALEALVSEGDEVLFPAPYWVSYPDMTRLFGGVPKPLVTEPAEGWKITARALQQALTPRSRVLILNNACNPTGVVYSRQELTAIVDVAAAAGLAILADEVYSGMVYDDVEFVSCGSLREHEDKVIVIQSCSKNFGMTGWRVGFALGPQDIIQVMTTIQGQSTTGTSLVSQWAAHAALSNAREVNAYVKTILLQRRDLFVKTFRQLFAPDAEAPASAIYFFAPLSSMTEETDSVAFCHRVLKGANVALVPGIAFGREGYVRFSFSETQQDIVEGLHALKDYLQSS